MVYRSRQSRACHVVSGALVLGPVARRAHDQSSGGSGSPLAGFGDPIAMTAEVLRIGSDRWRRRCAFEEQAAQALAILVLADELADVLA